MNMVLECINSKVDIHEMLEVPNLGLRITLDVIIFVYLGDTGKSQAHSLFDT